MQNLGCLIKLNGHQPKLGRMDCMYFYMSGFLFGGGLTLAKLTDASASASVMLILELAHESDQILFFLSGQLGFKHQIKELYRVFKRQ